VMPVIWIMSGTFLSALGCAVLRSAVTPFRPRRWSGTPLWTMDPGYYNKNTAQGLRRGILGSQQSSR